MIFGERLCQQRKAKGLSQEQFAEKLQVSRQAVSKWETGESQPDLAKLLMIRDILEVPLDDLCSDQPRPARSPQPAVNRSRGFNLFCVLTLIVGLLAGLAGLPMAFPVWMVAAVSGVLIAIALVSGLLSMGILKKSQPADLLR